VNRLTRLAAALPAVCLVACTGSLFHSKTAPPTVYLLSAGIGSAAAGTPAADTPTAGRPPGTPAAGHPLDLAILRLRVRTGLESDRIAILYPDRRLDYFAGARWSGPLGEVLQDLAVQEFHSRAHLGTISGDASVFASGYWLEIAVTDFQAEYTSAAQAPTVHVQLVASIGSANDTRILGQFVADARQPATENRLSAIVDAFARAADTALAEIAAHADDTLAKNSEAR
jgi:cholesterol transport system auxiliary component